MLRILTGFLFVFGVVPSPAMAYRTTADLDEYAGYAAMTWESPSASFELQGEPPPGLSLDAVRGAIVEAFTTWSRVNCSTVTVSLVASSEAPVVSGDRVNGIVFIREGWSEMGFSDTAAAVSDVRYRLDESVGLGFIAEADLFFNAEHFAWGLASADPGSRDVQAVATHETGHLLGLLHPCEADGTAPACTEQDTHAALHPEYQGLSQRDLGPDDIAGLCALYPSPTACPENPCPTGTGCVDGACIAMCAPGDCACEGGCLSDLGDPCVDESDCVAGRCGDRGVCTSSCVDSSDCPAEYRCVDGECDAAELGSYGDLCSTGDQCASLHCFVDGAASMCTRTCDLSAPCPGVDVCALVDGESVCRPPANAGCAVSSVSGSPTPWLGALVLFWLKRRRGSNDAR